MVTFSDGWDHRNHRRLSQKSYPAFIPLIDWIFGLDALKYMYIYIIYIYIYIYKQQQQQQKCSRVWAIFFKKRKSVLPSSARDTTPKNREKKADSKHEVPTPIKIRKLCLACLRNTCKNCVVWTRHIADDHSSLVFEATEMIIWKPPIVPVRLEVFRNDWRDRDDHMETRL